MKSLFKTILVCSLIFQASGCKKEAAIDREALVRRHTVQVTAFDPEAALSVGNGDFAFTVGVTGLQCFDSIYRVSETGIPTQTLSAWSWHSFPNTEGYLRENTMKMYDFHGRQVPFTALEQSPEGQYFRINPHPTALGQVSFIYKGRSLRPDDISGINQTLDMWTGVITSRFLLDRSSVEVITVAHPDQSTIGIQVRSELVREGKLSVRFHFPYAYQAKEKNNPPLIWDMPEAHTTRVEKNETNAASLLRTVDATVYRVQLAWNGTARLTEAAPHDFRLTANNSDIDFTCAFMENNADSQPLSFADTRMASEKGWYNYWMNGGVIDLSQSTDERWHELERRIVLSQYILKIHYASSFPPAEGGLVTPTWFGKHNSEVYFIHAAHFYQFGRVELLEKSLAWYQKILPLALEDAASKGWEGARWPKMSGIDGQQTPGGINPFIIWNFPNPVYLCELVYRAKPTKETLERYKDIVLESGKFLGSYPNLDVANNRYMLGPPLKASSEGTLESETWNPTFELALWYYGLQTAQEWRIRLGMGADSHWADILQRFSKPTIVDGKYVEIETEPHIYERQRGMPNSMLYAFGYVPPTPLIDTAIMRATFFEKVKRSPGGLKSWSSWALGQAVNTALRLEEFDAAVEIITTDTRSVHYLPQGYVRRPARGAGEAAVPAYMPVNGSFLNAAGMMAGGWDNAPSGNAPGFPKNSGWVVRTEGLLPMP